MLVGGFPDRWATTHRQLLKPLFCKSLSSSVGLSFARHELWQIELHQFGLHDSEGGPGGQVVDRLNRARRQPGVEPQLQVIV